MKSDSWKGVVYSSQKDAETVKIMGNLFFGGSGAGNRLRVNVKDLKTGRITSITVPRPHEYTVEQLLGRIPNMEGRQVTLKYRKKDIVDDRRPLADIFDEVMNSETSEQTTKTVNLFLERVERRGGLSRDWVLYVKTLTGRTFDIRFSNPQEVSTIGLKLLIEEECGVKPEQMRLVLDSQQLEESTRLVENIPGISNECTIHLVMKGS